MSFFLVMLAGCDRKVNENTVSEADNNPLPPIISDSDNDSNNSGNNETDSSNSSPNSSSSDGCYADGVGPQSNNYITINPVIGKGKSSGQVQWSSKDDPNFQSSGDQEIFLTDSRLNIRVLANPSPGTGKTTSTNENCQMQPINYKKLQVKVGIKVEGAYGYQSTYVFDDININGCSEVHQFSIPQSSSPMIIEVLEAKWDYSCTWAKEVNDSNYEIYCPFSYVWENDCFSIGLQVATDHTRDIPN